MMTFDKILRNAITKVQSLKDKRNPIEDNNSTRDIKKSNTLVLSLNPKSYKAFV